MNRRRKYEKQKRLKQKRKRKYIGGAFFTLLTIIIGITARGTYAYFMQDEINYKVSNLVVNYEKDEVDEYYNYSEGVSSLYQAQKGDVVFHILNVKGDSRYSNAPFLHMWVSSPSNKDITKYTSPRKLNIEEPKFMWYKCIAKASEIGDGTELKVQIRKSSLFGDSNSSTANSPAMAVDKNKVNHYFITINSDNSLNVETSNEQYNNEIMKRNKVFRSFYVYYYSQSELTNPSVTATDAIGNVNKTRKMRKLTSQECAEIGLTDTVYWYVTVGDDNQTKAQVELGVKEYTRSTLVFKEEDTTIKVVADTMCSAETGGMVFVRNGLYSDSPLNAVEKSLIIHYFDKTSDKITITPTIVSIGPSIPSTGSFDVGEAVDKWRTTDTFVWQTDKGYLEKEVLNYSIYDSYMDKSYNYSSNKNITELWIKEGTIFDYEPPDKANITLIITNNTVNSIALGDVVYKLFYYNVNGYNKSIKTVDKIDGNFTFTGEYVVPTSFETAKITFKYQISYNGNFGSDDVKIPYPLTTSEVIYNYPDSKVTWPGNNVNSSNYIKVKRDEENNITITTNMKTYGAN